MYNAEKYTHLLVPIASYLFVECYIKVKKTKEKLKKRNFYFCYCLMSIEQ